jgi:hypothetical protein
MTHLDTLLSARDTLRSALTRVDEALRQERARGGVASTGAVPDNLKERLAQILKLLGTEQCKDGASQQWLCATLRMAESTFRRAMLHCGSQAEKRGRLWFRKGQ